jgi:Flp pilus assembly pilin Flp
MKARLLRFAIDKSGAALTEFALVGPIIVLLIVAAIEMGVLLWTWNSVAKAAQAGARLAAVSAPVSSDISSITGLGGGVEPGGTMPYFIRSCDGATATCSDGGAFSQTALNWIVRGPDGVCGGAVGGRPGMCDVFPRIRPENVSIIYEQTGLGFAGRPGGPVPSITVRVNNLPFDTPVLRTISSLLSIQMPSFATTVTAEDLRSGAP